MHNILMSKKLAFCNIFAYNYFEINNVNRILRIEKGKAAERQWHKAIGPKEKSKVASCQWCNYISESIYIIYYAIAAMG